MKRKAYPSSRDPELDSGFEFDEDGRTDILGLPFFDVFFGADETADEYLDRILYRLSLALEEHITPGRWIIIGHPPPPPPPAIFPSPRILSATVLVESDLLPKTPEDSGTEMDFLSTPILKCTGALLLGNDLLSLALHSRAPALAASIAGQKSQAPRTSSLWYHILVWQHPIPASSHKAKEEQTQLHHSKQFAAAKSARNSLPSSSALLAQVCLPGDQCFSHSKLGCARKYEDQEMLEASQGHASQQGFARRIRHGSDESGTSMAKQTRSFVMEVKAGKDRDNTRAYWIQRSIQSSKESNRERERRFEEDSKNCPQNPNGRQTRSA
ncbi:hypothetical protein M5K25_004455 [Dendrobium thyrsiflorum]|uniref:Uncharacterized protein n=1 Tax=Dendrobium thyrsiflorum TaxID=117978 RepID=A0ABD0VMQ1_DENTH